MISPAQLYHMTLLLVAGLYFTRTALQSVRVVLLRVCQTLDY